MANSLIILCTYGIYLMVVWIIVVLSWYSEKMDPDNELPPSIWDEIFPNRKHAQRRRGTSTRLVKPSPYLLPLIPHKP
ncbi:MAG: hypothetical protein V7629_03185 [Motiliproteus sp.]